MTELLLRYGASPNQEVSGRHGSVWSLFMRSVLSSMAAQRELKSSLAPTTVATFTTVIAAMINHGADSNLVVSIRDESNEMDVLNAIREFFEPEDRVYIESLILVKREETKPLGDGQESVETAGLWSRWSSQLRL